MAALATGCTPSLHSVTKGPWNSKAKIVVADSGVASPTVWNGVLRGSVDARGNVLLTASNGCRLSGIAEPKFDRWAGPLVATDCSNAAMNATYDAVITLEESRLRLNARSIVMKYHGNVVSELQSEMDVAPRRP